MLGWQWKAVGFWVCFLLRFPPTSFGGFLFFFFCIFIFVAWNNKHKLFLLIYKTWHVSLLFRIYFCSETTGSRCRLKQLGISSAETDWAAICHSQNCPCPLLSTVGGNEKDIRDTKDVFHVSAFHFKIQLKHQQKM